ncbi:hypothetical protein GXP67_03335 [Rhodocytophaga rosea]|uniref:O-antigen ligase family protein n=1 Tax=Rhodocytophaga rosea TaxID=2704465 RepID=A0A6C0GCY3_9BACT|nr:hypothetical protein [Rhodocytophaga rosea]QHT65767.1 hypothetical protein GXP67_03335 [Rhodocytophaga rosea]
MTLTNKVEHKAVIFRHLLIYFYAFILLEGILRKWVVPGLATPLFFVKYIFSFACLIFFFTNKRQIKTKQYPFIGIVVFLLFYCFLELFNLDYSGTVLVGIIGLIVHFGFLSVAIVIPLVVYRKEHIKNTLFILTIICLGIFILGIIQYFSSPYGFINKYVSDDPSSIALVGKYPRIVTIFSYIGTYTSFLNFVLILLLLQVISITQINLKSIIIVATFLLGIVNIFMTGSRGPVGLFFIMATIIFFMYAVSLQGKKVLSYVFNFFILSALMYFVATQTEAGSASVGSFMDRVENSDNVGSRIEDAFNPFKYLDQAGLIGFGLGTTYQGAQSLMKPSGPLPSYEEESERLVLEVGLVGFILIVVMRMSIFLYSFKTYRMMKDPFLKLIALSLLIHQIPTVLIFNMQVFNWLENVVYWTEIGILVSINIIAQHEKNQYTGITPL